MLPSNVVQPTVMGDLTATDDIRLNGDPTHVESQSAAAEARNFATFFTVKERYKILLYIYICSIWWDSFS